jgi:GT2 family glycosyltransferase
MIATRNRAALLRRALASVRVQDYPRLEVLVLDDASEDGTSEYLRVHCPDIRLFRFDENRGLIAARNSMMAEARGEYIVSLDDDAYFLSADAISRVVQRMCREPEIGVVAFRIYENEGMETRGRAVEQYTHIFSGCAHCLRKAVLDEVGCYRAFFFRQGGESDLALRLLDKGYRILFMSQAMVFHARSPLGRDPWCVPLYTVKNRLLRSWLNEPFPWWVLSTGNAIVKCVINGARAKNLRHVLRGIWAAVGEVPRVRSLRRPISSKTIWLYLALRRSMIADSLAIQELSRKPPRVLRNLLP